MVTLIIVLSSVYSCSFMETARNLATTGVLKIGCLLQRNENIRCNVRGIHKYVDHVPQYYDDAITWQQVITERLSVQPVMMMPFVCSCRNKKYTRVALAPELHWPMRLALTPELATSLDRWDEVMILLLFLQKQNLVCLHTIWSSLVSLRWCN